MAKKKKGIKMTTVETGISETDPQEIMHEGIIYTKYDSEILRGYVPKLPLPEKKSPSLAWKGSRIGWDVFCQMISFFRWTYKETKGESQVRLAYNTALRLWAVVVLPQKRSSGLSTEEIAGDAGREEALSILKQGYNLVGTAHHHWSAGAFQSGTDKRDEENQDGGHFTFGKLDTDVLDAHARVTLGGLQYTTDLESWVETPAAPTALPETLVKKWNEYWLQKPSEVAFPDVWKDRLVVYVAPIAPGFGAGVHYGWEGRGMSSTNGTTSLWSTRETRLKRIQEENPDLPEIAAMIASGCRGMLDVTDRHEALEELLFQAFREDKGGPDKVFTFNRAKPSRVTRMPAGSVPPQSGLPVNQDLEAEAAARLTMAEEDEYYAQFQHVGM